MSQPPTSDRRSVDFSLGGWREIAAGVFVAVAEPAGVNLGLVVGADAALLIDTGSSPDQGRAVRSSITAVTDRPLVAVAVTHWHYDHAFGLTAFRDLPSIAHESVRGRLASLEAAAEATRLGFAAEDLTSPNQEIAVATAIDLGGRRVEIAHLGEGHTDGDLIIVVPDADLVFVGDLVESAGPPAFGPDSVPGAWAGTLDSIIGLMTAATMLVPGHGAPVDREFVFEQRGQVASTAAGLVTPTAIDRPQLPLV